MDKNELKIFCLVAEQESFSKAAKALHLSQPAVSTHIKNLEGFYSGQLFERTSHGVVLTKMGEIFYTYAKRLLALQDEMEQQIACLLSKECKQVIVGASTTIGNVALPCTIYMFKEEYPEVNISLDIANTEDVVRKVLANEVDIGVIEGYPTSPLCAQLVTSDELVVIVPPNHTLREDSITLSDFLKLPIILREDGSATREILSAGLEQQGYSMNDLNVIIEMSTISAIKSAVEAGMGAAVVPSMEIRKEVYLKTLRVLKIQELPLPITYHLVYPEYKSLSSTTKRFIKFLTDAENSSFC